MDDVTALRDALVARVLTWCEHDIQPDPAWLSTDLDALIAAVEARAAITPERLAKAMVDAGMGAWDFEHIARLLAALRDTA